MAFMLFGIHLDNVIIRRLQLLRAAQPSRVKIISDNPKHAAEEVALSELDVVGKALRVLPSPRS
jgi:hypothetical protein